jgi:transcriptional regulator with XRE-family HTH domain
MGTPWFRDSPPILSAMANDELREFLRSRRARLAPTDVGLPAGGRSRRVPGLRREELAGLAGVSVDYYTRLEQGRDISVSKDVLLAVAAALRLRDDERDYLLELAQPTRVTRRARAMVGPNEQVRQSVASIVELLPVPAFVVGRRLDVLASNRLARLLLCDFEALQPEQRNHARWVFLDPVARGRYLDWAAIARDNVASLRMQAGRYPDDARLAALVGELSVKSPDFARWWPEHEVLRRRHGTKRYLHPDIGELTIAYEALTISDAADQILYAYTAEAGSTSEQALRRLADLATDQVSTPDHTGSAPTYGLEQEPGAAPRVVATEG